DLRRYELAYIAWGHETIRPRRLDADNAMSAIRRSAQEVVHGFTGIGNSADLTALAAPLPAAGRRPTRDYLRRFSGAPNEAWLFPGDTCLQMRKLSRPQIGSGSLSSVLAHPRAESRRYGNSLTRCRQISGSRTS